jgi:hypothetical protein
MIDSDDLCYRFNIQVVCNKKAKSIFLTEEKYILNVFIKFHMIDHCKHVFIAMIKFIVEFTKTISPFAPINQFEMKYVPYANVIGSLMYLVINILLDLVHRLVVFIMANPCGPLH